MIFGQVEHPTSEPQGGLDGDIAKKAHAGRILQSITALPRVIRLYPAGHQRTLAHLEALVDLCVEYFDAGDEPSRLVFTVAGTELEWNGLEAPGDAEVIQKLSFKLRRRRVRSLEILTGIAPEEFGALAELLAADHRDVVSGGGAPAYVAPGQQPHLDLTPFDGGWGDGTTVRRAGIPQEVLDLIAESESADTVMTRFEAVRVACGEHPEDEVLEAFEEVVDAYFRHPEWTKMSPDEAARAVQHFLDRVEEALTKAEDKDEVALSRRIASLKRLFASMSPTVAARAEGGPEHKATSVAYEVEGADELLDAARGSLSSAARFVERSLELHDHEEASLLIRCELLVTAADADAYQERRGAFLQGFRDGRHGSAAITRMMRFLTESLPPLRFETRESLLQEVFDITHDEEALTDFLESMADKPDIARPFLNRFATREEPFPLLVRLLTAPRLEAFRHIVRAKFIEAARAKSSAFRVWARNHREDFFRVEIFEPLFQSGADVLCTICKEILVDGGDTERNHLIERLTHQGSETALRILILGMAASHGRTTDLVRALSAFRHPLAVAALREIVHRNNTGAVRDGEARAAIETLNHLGTEDSWKFLCEVARKRMGLLPVYRKELRSLASRVLSEGRRRR